MVFNWNGTCGWIIPTPRWGYNSQVRLATTAVYQASSLTSHCEGEETILRVQRMRKWEVTLSERQGQSCAWGSVSNPFGGGVFIWIVSVVLTELFSHFSGDVFVRIVGVVVAIDLL